MRLRQMLKEVRYSKVISFLRCLQASGIVAFLSLCWADRARRSRGWSAAVWLQRDLSRTSRLDAHNVGADDRSEYVLENTEQFLTTRPSILVTDCKSLDDVIHIEGASPASTDKRLAIELTLLEVDRYEISNSRLLDETRLKKVRDSPTQNSAGSTVVNYCRRGHVGQTQTWATDS